jgi:uncharacterized membrane protein (UPF0127 family)
LATEVTLSRPDGRVVCERCLVAARPLRRMRGLLGRRDLPRGEGILLRPAASIHTFFMRFAIDAVFLDRDDVVVGIEPEIRPWRLAGRRGSRAVLELPAGECVRRGINVGDALGAA